jgi:uncharacterized repeat protein (TIGR04138 family)
MSDNNRDFNEVVDLIIRDDARFTKGVYYFMREALDHTLSNLKRKKKIRKSNHVSGQQLLEGIREYALDQYGPMTMTLLEQWGVNACEDFGEIVFNLVEHGVFGKTESDQKQDFSQGYDFRKAFVQPYLPANRNLKENGENKEDN